jgi:hypothetical protein
MQCLLFKIYFWKGFSYILQIDMHLICAPMLAKFYSCKKWVLHCLCGLVCGCRIVGGMLSGDTTRLLERAPGEVALFALPRALIAAIGQRA